METSARQLPNPNDPEVCDRIPISFITSVQPHGYVVVACRREQKIVQVSANFPETLGITTNDLLGKPLAQFIMAQAMEDIREKTGRNGGGQNIPTHLFFSTRSKTIGCLATMHVLPEYLILELEEHKPHESTIYFLNVYQQVKQVFNSLKISESLEEMLQVAAHDIKKLSGYDRVMIYRFDKDWNGTVIGEALEAGMDPYFDLRFPATDIPRQARDLYLRNPYRNIPDSGYRPVPLVPEFNPITNTPTNLSDTVLRGVPAVHLEYLQNMGVGASMSASIVKDNQLWGLISCHHRQPKYISYELRSAFELLANIISSELSARESDWLMQRRAALTEIHSRLLEKMSAENDFVKGLASPSSGILEYLDISGAAIVNDNRITLTGITPTEPEIEELVVWLAALNPDKVYATESLPLEFEPARAYKSIGSGLIALSLSAENKAWLLGFRPEVIQQVSWGGNPNDHVSISHEQGRQVLHPRNSFERWKQTVRFRAVPWLAHHLEAAATLRISILEVILKMQILKRMIAEEEVYKLSVVASKTDNAVMILDKNGTVEWINEAFTKYTGVDLKEAVGRNLLEINKAANTMREVGEIISKSAYQSTSFSKDISIERDNKRYFINFNFTPITNPQDEYERCIAIGSDITQMREHAQQLETINKELDKFAYVIAHDLKAPLRSIESLVTAIEGNFADNNHTDSPELLNFLTKSVKRMSHLITDVLSYSRIGRINMKLEEVSVHEILKDVLEWLNPPATVTVDIRNNLPVIQSVRVDMQQVFSNLISNAIKYGCEDQCHIVIDYEQRGQEHLFTVSDNGPGISDEHHERIFEMFHTIHTESVKHSELSTGIGLATVKKMVEDKGGRIWVESIPGNGASFKFTLPTEALEVN